MANGTLTYVGELTITSCWCGIRVAIPSDLYAEARRTGRNVYCPLGHSFVYGTTTAKELEDERARTKRLRSLLADEREQHRHTERRLNATRGVVTRTKKRIASGVCPCCNRTFVALGQHMKRQHPHYVEQELP